MPSSVSDYEMLESIGAGTFGTCKKIRRKKDGKVLVWKEIDYSRMSEDSKQMLVVEVNLLRQLRHEYIVRYYDRIIDKAKSVLYIIMEYCENGDLASYIQKIKTDQLCISESFVWRVCCQLASALKECHSRSRNGSMVLHRDLKPANIFLDSHNNVKIGDFGLARILQPHISHAKTCVGTPYYMSPEQLLGNVYNEKSDVWSLGVILYELCALKLPFTADSQFELIKKVTAGRVQRIPSNFSDDLFDVICLLLELDPSKRYSVELLLLHPTLAAQSMTTIPVNEDYKARFEALRLREEQLNMKQNIIVRREASVEQSHAEIAKRICQLDERERYLNTKEKIIDDRMSRAEKLMKEYTELKLELIARSSSENSGLSEPTNIEKSSYPAATSWRWFPDLPSSTAVSCAYPDRHLPKETIKSSSAAAGVLSSSHAVLGLSSGSSRGNELEKNILRHVMQLKDELGRARRQADELRLLKGDATLNSYSSDKLQNLRDLGDTENVTLARALLGLPS